MSPMSGRWFAALAVFGIAAVAAICSSAPAAANDANAGKLLGGSVETFDARFNQAALKHGSTLRLVPKGCVRQALVTCTYKLDTIGLLAAADHGKPLFMLVFVAGKDSEAIDLVMGGLLTMSVFSPNTSRPELQEHFKRLMASYEAEPGKPAVIVLDNVEYALSNSVLGVTLKVGRR